MRKNNIFAQKKIKHIVLSCTRRHVESERKLGEYFFLDTFNPGFQSIRTISKGFQSVSTF